VKKLVFLFALLLVGVASAAPSVVSTTQTSATLEGLDCGSKYRFEIRKYTAKGELSSTAESVDAQTKSCPDTQPPSAPQDLAPTGRTQTSISVSWSASVDDVGVTGYLVYRGGAKVDSTTATSYTFSGLSCGTSYRLAVEAYDTAGNRSATSEVSASTAACPPPSCSSGAYSARYYGNMTLSGTPLLQRCETAIDHSWGIGSPTGVPADRFSTRWTGTHSFTAGSYQFTATADDGIRVWVDGTPLIDAWKDQAPTTYRATRILTAGEHAVKVEYYENGGGAVARVSWQLSQLPVQSADMEEGNLDDWYYPSTEAKTGYYGGGEYNSGTGNSVASTAVAHSGTYSAAQTIDVSSGSPSGTRLFRWEESDRYRELYYSAWFYFPQRMRLGAGWFLLWQWKSTNATRNDPLWGLLIENDPAGEMKLYLSRGPGEIANYHQSVATIPVGRWFQVRAHYRCADDNTGFVRVWQDGQLLFDKSGIRTSYSWINGYGNPWSCQWALNAYGNGFTPSVWTSYVDDAQIGLP
jgi:chitodextrinase